jgi:hypothetical protein
VKGVRGIRGVEGMSGVKGMRDVKGMRGCMCMQAMSSLGWVRSRWWQCRRELVAAVSGITPGGGWRTVPALHGTSGVVGSIPVVQAGSGLHADRRPEVHSTFLSPQCLVRHGTPCRPPKPVWMTSRPCQMPCVPASWPWKATCPSQARPLSHLVGAAWTMFATCHTCILII